MPEGTKGIFVSYRRDDTSGYAGRLADRFNEHFGEHEIFRDIDSLEPGLDFAEAIERALNSSEVLIAVIGDNWLTAADSAGHKRLENPDDYVRTEIATALQRNIRVIPLLVQGASMPSAPELPDDLAPLARRNAFEIHDASWNDDVRRLITILENVLGRGRREVPRINNREASGTANWIEKGVGQSRQEQPRTITRETRRTPIWLWVLLGALGVIVGLILLLQFI